MSVPYSDDDDDFGWSTGFYGGGQTVTTRLPIHPWDRLLTIALYARWSKDDDEAYECLGEAYNQYVAKTDEDRAKILYKRIPASYS